jgi:flagellar motility protein MotE (MotC chaperone)
MRRKSFRSTLLVLAVPLLVTGASPATAAPERADEAVSMPPSRAQHASEPLVLQPTVAQGSKPRAKPTAAAAPNLSARPGEATSATPAESMTMQTERPAAAEPGRRPKPSVKRPAALEPVALPRGGAGPKNAAVQGLNPGAIPPSPPPQQAPEKAQVAARPASPGPLQNVSAVNAETAAPKPALVQPPAPLQAVPPSSVNPAKPAPAAKVAAAPAPAVPSDVQQYCTNIAPFAAEAEGAWQARKLLELDGQLKARIAELEAKRVEYKEWLERREEFVKKAEEGLVAIYSRMRPDAAASQIAAMEDGTAAAVLARLNARTASAILNEMTPGRAARLTSHMAGATNRDGKKS